jgi:hypothetical protein
MPRPRPVIEIWKCLSQVLSLLPRQNVFTRSVFTSKVGHVRLWCCEASRSHRYPRDRVSSASWFEAALLMLWQAWAGLRLAARAALRVHGDPGLRRAATLLHAPRAASRLRSQSRTSALGHRQEPLTRRLTFHTWRTGHASCRGRRLRGASMRRGTKSAKQWSMSCSGASSTASAARFARSGRRDRLRAWPQLPDAGPANRVGLLGHVEAVSRSHRRALHAGIEHPGSLPRIGQAQSGAR